jgi:hypothetical protein
MAIALCLLHRKFHVLRRPMRGAETVVEKSKNQINPTRRNRPLVLADAKPEQAAMLVAISPLDD